MNSARSIGTGGSPRIGLKSNIEPVRFQANYASGKQRTVRRIARACRCVCDMQSSSSLGEMSNLTDFRGICNYEIKF
jgi:hypothetical protein